MLQWSEFEKQRSEPRLLTTPVMSERTEETHEKRKAK
jgi:hypothetical protein